MTLYRVWLHDILMSEADTREYADTFDNRLDPWYLDTLDSTLWDRRGPGYAAQAEAADAAEQQPAQ